MSSSVRQGLTLAHFRAKLQDLRVHIAHVRAHLEHLRDTSTGRNTLTAAQALSVRPHQGLTLVHFSAQLERFVWDRGCA